MSEELTTQPEDETKAETPAGEPASDVSNPPDENTSTEEAQSDSDAEASLAAGYQRATKGEAPAPEPAPEPEYTPEQIKEAFEKLSALETEVASRKARDDKVNGALGFLTNAVRELKAQPGRQPAKLNADSFKKLKEAYPELAEALSEDLGEVIGGGSVDEEAIANKAAERAAETVKKAELDRLSDDHPDWRDVVKSEGFAKFRAAWTPELQEKFDSSWNASFVGKRITEFKEAQAKAQAQANASERNLRRSIPARGVTVAHTANLSDEERFARGFKRARGLA